MTSAGTGSWPVCDELCDWGEAPPNASASASVCATTTTTITTTTTQVAGTVDLSASPPQKKKWVVIRRRVHPTVSLDDLDDDFLPADPAIVHLDLAIEGGLDITRKYLHDHPAEVAELNNVLLIDATGVQVATALFYKFYKFFHRSEFGGIAFDTHVARRVFEVPAKDDGIVNLFGIVHRFIQICEQFQGADFAPATFAIRSTPSKNGKFDRDYDIGRHIGQRTLADSLFTDLFKAFRSIVTRAVSRITKTYDTPDFAQASSWKYTVKVDGEYEKRQSDQFVDFMKEYVPVFVALERLSKPLTEVFSIFDSAKTIKEEEEVEEDN